MKFRIEVICVSENGTEERSKVTAIERQELAMETLGLNLAEGKSILEGLQDFIVAQQTAEDLEQRRACPRCGRAHTSKGTGTIDVKTVFGSVELPNPRWNRCPWQPGGPKTFRPMTHWLCGRTSPELLYLETKWGSLSPYGKVAELLKDVLPVGDALNQETVRTNLHATAERLEQELGEEQLCLFDRSQVDWEQQGLPDGPITVGIDGGYVRAAHKEGWFEVIADRSVVAFRREAEDETPSAKCFAVEHPHVVEARGTDVSTRLEQRSFVIRKSNSNSFRRVCENLTDSCECHTKR